LDQEWGFGTGAGHAGGTRTRGLGLLLGEERELHQPLFLKALAHHVGNEDVVAKNLRAGAHLPAALRADQIVFGRVFALWERGRCGISRQE
jgi:hypothetical protein